MIETGSSAFPPSLRFAARFRLCCGASTVSREEEEEVEQRWRGEQDNVFKANAMNEVDAKGGAEVGGFGRPYQVALCRTRNTTAVLGHNQIQKNS